MSNLKWMPLVGVALVAGSLRAQTADSVAAAPPVQFYTFTPQLARVGYEAIAAHERDYETEAGQELDARYDWGSRINANVTLPAISLKHGFAISTSLSYNRFAVNADEVSFDVNPERRRVSEAFSTSQFTLGASKSLKVKNKTVVFSGSVTTSGSQFWEVEKVGGILSAIVPLVNTPDRSLAVGLTYVFNSAVNFPIPSVVYAQRLNPRWTFELLLPSHIQTRHIFANDLFAIGGVKVDGSLLYLENGSTFFQGEDYLEMRDFDLKLFVGVEKALVSDLWVHAETGYSNKVNSTLNVPTDARTNYLRADPTGNFYLKAGLFYRPVWGGKLMQKTMAKRGGK